MEQGELFNSEPIDDICRNRHGREEYSEAANGAAHPNKAKQRSDVLAFIRSHGNATTFEVHEGLDIPYTAASARMSELKRDGAIMPLIQDGVKVSRPTGFGRQAGVYRVCS